MNPLENKLAIVLNRLEERKQRAKTLRQSNSNSKFASCDLSTS